MMEEMGRREYLRWIWLPPEYDFAKAPWRKQALEEERRLSKVVKGSTDAEEVERARADLYERVMLRAEARGGFKLSDFMSGAFSGYLKRHSAATGERRRKRQASGVEEDDEEDTASSTICCRDKKRQRIVVRERPPRIQDASESVASHQGVEEVEEEAGGEASSSCP
ncbi:hypothetical protein E2562_037979 [Oryza meyeriana var. granulata]|uniref:Uncharacterized protein n=1 Tax=Oryza meyeriana var. granulata TaxID=110450 RepID=A0A6G1CLS4_9ORYZ|nr:hypothetical protein E2562_037979 [Oryza meyeriana var. granulata]